MKRYIILLITMLLAMPFIQHASAQTIAAALQKQMSPDAAHWNLAAWETLLPAADQETIIYPESSIAEHVILNAAGLPAEITLLTRQNGTWTPQTKTFAYFDGYQDLTLLETWTWQQYEWVPATSAERTMDTLRHESTFERFVWANDAWIKTYAFTSKSTLCARIDTVKP